MWHAGAWEDGIAAYTHGDYAQAVAFMETAAEQGDAAAQYNLGIAYANGGTNRDYVTSIKWFRLAAEQGAAPAQFNLGVIYQRQPRRAPGITSSLPNGICWRPRPANPARSSKSASSSPDGEGVPRDLVRAHVWLTLAAAQEQGEANAAMHRDIVARLISADQLYKARQLARAWASGNSRAGVRTP